MCSAPHPEGFLILCLDNFHKFQYYPPAWQPKTTQIQGHNLQTSENFATKTPKQ